jgi:hypothetical protein
LSARRNPVQNAPLSLSPTSEPEDLAAAVGADPSGDHHGLGGHPGAAAAAVPADPGLAVGGIEEHIGEGDLGQ